MSPILWRLLTLALCWLLSGAASAGELRQKLFTQNYSGSRDRQYQVFVPTAYDGQTTVPMVMVLHGCRQTEANMINETRFREVAERDGFIVVYPFITSFDGLRNPNCWGFFLDQHIHQGAGEVEDLHQIALEVEAAFRIDPQRRYVTGLSSGAGMAVVLATALQRVLRRRRLRRRPALLRDLLLGGLRLRQPGHLQAGLGRRRRHARGAAPAGGAAPGPDHGDPLQQRLHRQSPWLAQHPRQLAPAIRREPDRGGERQLRGRRGGLHPHSLRDGPAHASWRRCSTRVSAATSSARDPTTGWATTGASSPTRPGRAPRTCCGPSSAPIPSPTTAVPLDRLGSGHRKFNPA